MAVAGRQGRHVKDGQNHKDWFTPATGGTESYQLGAWTGYRVNDDTDVAHIVTQVPYNFAKLEELKICLLALATASPMYMRLVTDYCKAGEAYFEGNELINPKQINTVLNRQSDLDVMDAFDVKPVDPLDKLSMKVDRVAGQSPTHNTNAIVLGAYCKVLLE